MEIFDSFLLKAQENIIYEFRYITAPSVGKFNLNDYKLLYHKLGESVYPTGSASLSWKSTIRKKTFIFLTKNEFVHIHLSYGL